MNWDLMVGVPLLAGGISLGLWQIGLQVKNGIEALKSPVVPRPVAFIVHVQGRTEQDETMDFAISLYEDEGQDAWEKKLNAAFLMREKRLSFQNERVLAMMGQDPKPKEGNA